MPADKPADQLELLLLDLGLLEVLEVASISQHQADRSAQRSFGALDVVVEDLEGFLNPGVDLGFELYIPDVSAAILVDHMLDRPRLYVFHYPTPENAFGIWTPMHLGQESPEA